MSTFVLIPSDKCNLWLSSRKHLYATDGDYYRKSQSKCIVVKPNSHGCVHITLQHVWLRKCCGWGGRFQSQRIKNFTVRFYLLGMSEATHIVSPTWLPKCDLKKYNTNEHVKANREKPMRSHSYTKKCKKLGELEMGVVVSTGKNTQMLSP